MPRPSCQRILIRSPRRPRNTNRSPACGSRFRPCWICKASPFIPRRISVYPVAIHTRTPEGTGIMDLDGTISTEVAVLSQGKKEDYDDIVTMGLALSNDGKPVPSQATSPCGLIPKGAKNVAVAKDFLKYLIQPKVINERLKTGLGR